MSSSEDEYEGPVRRSRVSLDKLDNQRYTRPVPPQPSSSSLITASSTPIPQLPVHDAHDVPVIPLAPAKPAPFLPAVWQWTQGSFTDPFQTDTNHDFSQILASLPSEVTNADLSVAGKSDFLGASRCNATLYLLTNRVCNAQEMAPSSKHPLQ